MDIFIDGEFEENNELESVLQQINPSEGDDPESVASKNQGGEAPQQKPTSQDPSPELDEDDDEIEEDEVNSTKPSLYSSLANVLYNEGVLPSLDLKTAKVENVDDLVEAIKNEITNNEYSSLNERQRKYLEVLKEGLPEEMFFEVEKMNYGLDTLTDDFLEEEENSEARAGIIRDYFLLKGFDEDEADKLTQQQLDLATDIEFSKKARNALKEYNVSRYQDTIEQAKAEKAKQQESFNRLKQTIETTDKVIDGMIIDKKSKKEILDIITKPVAVLEDGTQVNELMKLQIEDPVDFQYKLAYLVHITKGLKDFSAFTTVKKAKSKAVREFENVLSKSTLDFSGDFIDGDSIDLGADFMLDL